MFGCLEVQKDFPIFLVGTHGVRLKRNMEFM
jgi:hypothetical protein